MSAVFQPFMSVLDNFLKLNLSRQKCLLMLMEGFIKCRTVNLAIIGTAMTNNVKCESNYTRFRRFIKEVRFDYRSLSRCILGLLGVDPEKMTLVLDRTNWKFGKTHINILYLSCIWNGLSIPLFGVF